MAKTIPKIKKVLTKEIPVTVHLQYGVRTGPWPTYRPEITKVQ